MPFDCFRAWPRPILAVLICGAAAMGAGSNAAKAQIGLQSVDLIDRLCAQTLRTNEEDRLYGMISLTVRATISYRGGEFQRNVIDDAVQNALDALLGDCANLKAADASKRVDMAVEVVSDATSKLLDKVAAARKGHDKDSPYVKKPVGKVTAADLSSELSSQEIDQSLDSMPPRERALSLFLYASKVTPQEIAAAVGEKPGAIARQLGASKADLMHIFDENWEEPISGPKADPAIKYTESGEGFAALMTATEKPAPSAPPAAPAPDATASASGAPSAAAPVTATPTDPPAGGLGSLKVTGISDMIYSGWSLIATTQGLPRGQRIAITQPFLLEPDSPGIKRMLVTDVAEISDPDAETRRFLLKAYAIDADKDGAGLHDSFHVGAPLDNAEAKKTLANPNLTSIEVTHCLWHDFGAGPDPGLCRQIADATPPATSAPSSPAAAAPAPAQTQPRANP
jgi:DNA-directed RNA polymerase specialized sigma24 family protein